MVHAHKLSTWKTEARGSGDQVQGQPWLCATLSQEASPQRDTKYLKTWLPTEEVHQPLAI